MLKAHDDRKTLLRCGFAVLYGLAPAIDTRRSRWRGLAGSGYWSRGGAVASAGSATVVRIAVVFVVGGNPCQCRTPSTKKRVQSVEP